MFRADSKWMQVMGTASDFILLNLLFLLCCLPLVTIGASSAALYTVTRRIARKEHPAVSGAFIAAFRANFRQTLPLTLLLAVPQTAGMVLRVLMKLQIFTVPGWFPSILTLATAILGVVWTYVWPLQAWFENKPMSTLKNAVLLPFGNPLIAAVATLVNLLPLVWLDRNPVTFLQISFFWLAAAFSLTAFLNTQLLRLQCRHYLADNEYVYD